ncbi:MAG TPA: type II toxin-antitoxin system RelE/ParE family toxin [Candidatus Binatia bacterium]|nr:type II toxin-antitoxin system RelE/ParE family toxin [Candidatus Binatia bacterium]
MIRSFKSKETEKIFSRQKSASVPDEIQRLALRELRTLDHTPVAKEEWVRANHNGGSNRGAPAGDRARYSIQFHREWRLSFEWSEGDAYNVDLVEGDCAL